jgi:hypothetical protein
MSIAPKNQARRLRIGQSMVIACWIVLFTAAFAPAQAQTVQKCMIDGHAVYQSSACPVAQPPAAVSVAVPPPAEVASAPKKKTLAELLRERDGNQSQSHRSEFQRDGADVLRSRMGAV